MCSDLHFKIQLKTELILFPVSQNKCLSNCTLIVHSKNEKYDLTAKKLACGYYCCTFGVNTTSGARRVTPGANGMIVHQLPLQTSSPQPQPTSDILFSVKNLRETF